MSKVRLRQKEVNMKKFLSLLLVLALSISMVACGGDSTTDSSATPTPNNGGTTPTTLKVYMPDGAPALGLAVEMMNPTASDKYKLDMTVVDASTIATYVTGENPAADVCIMPINAAAKLLGDGSKYKLLGSVTNGNIYIITKNGVQITKDNVSELVGKTVGVVNLANVPGLTTQIVFKMLGLKVNVMGNDSTVMTDAVNLVAVNATDVTPAGTCDYYIVPEPAATTKVTKAGFTMVGSLQDLYSDEGMYPQAVLVVKADLLANNPDLADYLASVITNNANNVANADVASLVNAIETNLTEGMTPSLSAGTLNADAIKGCNIKFVPVKDNHKYFTDFIDKLIDINANSTKAVEEGFFFD